MIAFWMKSSYLAVALWPALVGGTNEVRAGDEFSTPMMSAETFVLSFHANLLSARANSSAMCK